MKRALDLDIRPRRPADMPAVRALLVGSSLPTAGIDALGPALMVATAGERVVGCAGFERHGPVALLRSVAVDPEWRGHGLGARLTQAALDAAATAGMTRVYLLTETAPEFFRRFGFRPIPRTEAEEAVQDSPEFAELCPASAIVMVRATGADDAETPQ